MAMVILPFHDCLGDRSLSVNSPNHIQNPNPNPNPNHRLRCGRRKRSPSDGNRRSNLSSSSTPTKGLVMGQVKILKRGEELKPRMFGAALPYDDGGGGGGGSGSGSGGGDNNDIKMKIEVDLCSTQPMGPDAEVVQKEIKVPDVYAGPTSIVASPSPSRLPFPTALVRTRVETGLRKLLNI